LQRLSTTGTPTSAPPPRSAPAEKRLDIGKIIGLRENAEWLWRDIAFPSCFPAFLARSDVLLGSVDGYGEILDGR
jgi:hypothetical protein